MNIEQINRQQQYILKLCGQLKRRLAITLHFWPHPKSSGEGGRNLY